MVDQPKDVIPFAIIAIPATTTLTQNSSKGKLQVHIINMKSQAASSHGLPCSIEGCRGVLLTWNPGTCMHLYKMDQHISHGEEGS